MDTLDADPLSVDSHWVDFHGHWVNYRLGPVRHYGVTHDAPPMQEGKTSIFVVYCYCFFMFSFVSPLLFFVLYNS